MKKIVIGAAIAAVIGVGAYLSKQKIGDTVGDVAETQVTEFISQNLNKPIVIKELQSHPLIETATITITEKTDTTIRSLLTIATADDSISIPLNSEIIRGKVDYNGKSFGFGKIVTKPDLSSLDELPAGVTNDTFSLVQHIDFLGNVSELYRIAPIQATEDDIVVDFKGIDAVVNTQLLDRSEYDASLSVKGLNMAETATAESFSLSAFDYQMKLEKSGNYTATSTPMTFTFTESRRNENFSVDVSKATYSGIYKTVDGLDMPINNGSGLFDFVTFGDEKLKFTINNLKIAGGLYEVDGSDATNLTAAISGDFDTATLPKTLPDGRPMPVKLQSFALNYALNNVSKETLNLYQQVMGSFDIEEELTQEQGEALFSSLQKSDAQFKLSANITAEEGKTDADIALALNEVGKAANFEELAYDVEKGPDTAAQYFNGDALVTMDKGLADALELTMMAQMFLGITPENNQLTLKAALKDGQATLNGQPIPLR